MPSLRVAKILSGLTGSRDGSAVNFPQRLVDACADAVEVSGVGMVLMTDAGPVGVIAASDGPAKVMEDLQFTLGVGPCVDASQSGRPVLVPDLHRSGLQRWPTFTAGALEVGIRAIFAYPLRVGAIRLGVLDLYRDVPGALTEHEQRVALDYADAATSVLLHLQSQTPVPGGDADRADTDDTDGSGTGSEPAVLLDVVNQRAEVHQASGMVAVQADVGLPAALVLLRARAYASGRQVLDVARDVLAGRVSFEDGGPDDVDRSDKQDAP